MTDRKKQITKVTLVGSAVNLALTAAKLFAGFFGRSAAMVADGVHSLSDLVTDFIVLVFVNISSKGKDRSHDYGHGKFETLASLLISLLLLVVAAELMASSIKKILLVLGGGEIAVPGMIALWAAVVSIVLKEGLYWYTYSVGKKIDSPAMIANAWHHRSDALSSVGSFLGIGGAILLGHKWVILDPLAGCIISIAIIVVAVKMAVPALKELLDVSLPDDKEDEIVRVAESVPGVLNVHELKTRQSGPGIIIDAHIVVRPDMTVSAAHDIATAVEDALKSRFGASTQTSIHIEPDENAL